MRLARVAEVGLSTAFFRIRGESSHSFWNGPRPSFSIASKRDRRSALTHLPDPDQELLGFLLDRLHAFTESVDGALGRAALELDGLSAESAGAERHRASRHAMRDAFEVTTVALRQCVEQRDHLFS